MTFRQSLFVIILGLTFCLMGAMPAQAQLAPGTILVTDRGFGGPGVLFAIDPTTGDRRILSGDTVGTGPNLFQPVGVTVNAQGQIYVVDQFDSILEIDPNTGDRSTVASGLDAPFDIVVNDQGQLFVDSLSNNIITSVDPGTGNTSVFSGPSRGTGPALNSFSIPGSFGLGIDNQGNLLADSVDGLVRIDSAGNRTLISGPDLGTGTSFFSSPDFAVASDDTIFIAGGFISVDPITGDRTDRSLNDTSSINLHGAGFAIDSNDQIVISNVFGPGQAPASILLVDPLAGEFTIISGDGVGAGPDLIDPAYIAIVPVPEPSSMALLGIGGALLLRRRR